MNRSGAVRAGKRLQSVILVLHMSVLPFRQATLIAVSGGMERPRAVLTSITRTRGARDMQFAGMAGSFFRLAVSVIFTLVFLPIIGYTSFKG